MLTDAEIERIDRDKASNMQVVYIDRLIAALRECRRLLHHHFGKEGCCAILAGAVPSVLTKEEAAELLEAMGEEPKRNDIVYLQIVEPGTGPDSGEVKLVMNENAMNNFAGDCRPNQRFFLSLLKEASDFVERMD